MSPIIQTRSDDNELLRSIESTYRVLRIGLGVIALLLPPTLYLFGPKPLLGSMSAYYYTDEMRDVFVGVLFATGATLCLYKGFSGAEDWALNLAGVFAVLVALIPMSRDPQASVTAHGTFAVLFFVCLAYVAVFRAKDTLALTDNQKRITSYKRIYRGLGLAMVFFPLGAALILGVTQADRVKDKRTIIFAAEFLGIYAFGAFWLVKTAEIRGTQREQEARPNAPAPGTLVHDRKGSRVRVVPTNRAV